MQKNISLLESLSLGGFKLALLYNKISLYNSGFDVTRLMIGLKFFFIILYTIICHMTLGTVYLIYKYMCERDVINTFFQDLLLKNGI